MSELLNWSIKKNLDFKIFHIVNPTTRADWNAFQIGFIISNNINAMFKDIHFNFCEVCSTIAVRSSVGNSSRF